MSNAEDYQKAVGFMSQHLVALTCNYESVEKDGSVTHRGTLVLSGWLLELRGRCFWVTAGHCLKETLDDNIKAGHIRVVGGGFMDYLGYRAEHHHVYPFTYERGCGFYLMDFEHGLDFALIPIDELQRRAFEQNRNLPVERNNWIHQHTLSFDFYRMLGIPVDRVSETTTPDGNVNINVQPTLMAINKIDYEAAKDVPLLKSDAWFFGEIDPGVSNQTVKGMSGGPIFGFRKRQDGSMLYHVVALQSWWDEKRRIIFGCSVPYFAEKLYEVLGLPRDIQDVGAG